MNQLERIWLDQDSNDVYIGRFSQLVKDTKLVARSQ